MDPDPDPPRAWVLNLDADDELARTGGHTPNAAARRRMQTMAATVAATLVPPDDVWWVPGDPAPAAARGRPGVAWCPTPRALSALSEAGAVPPADAPPLAVLRAANHRALAHRWFPEDLPGARLTWSVDEALAAVAAPPPRETGSTDWLLKRAHGHAGRGRRRVTCGRLDESDRRWVAASFARGLDAPALVVEPWVSRLADHSVQGWRDPGDPVPRLGPLCRQAVGDDGRWLRTWVLAEGERDPALAAALEAAGQRAANALADIGYHGPFGIDAFLWRDLDGLPRLRRCTDLNARYTTGWGIGPPER